MVKRQARYMTMSEGNIHQGIGMVSYHVTISRDYLVRSRDSELGDQSYELE